MGAVWTLEALRTLERKLQDISEASMRKVEFHIHCDINFCQNWTILSEQSSTQLVHFISTLVLSEQRQIHFHRIFNEGHQCHND